MDWKSSSSRKTATGLSVPNSEHDLRHKGECMKLLTIMWSSFIPILKDAARASAVFALKAYSNKQLNLDPGVVEDVGKEMKTADLILLYRTTEPFWDEVEEEIAALGGRIPVVSVGPEPSYWKISNVSPEIVTTVYRYILFNGAENFREMLKFLASTLFSMDLPFSPPKETAWEGICHPQWGGPFKTTQGIPGNLSFAQPPTGGNSFSKVQLGIGKYGGRTPAHRSPWKNRTWVCSPSFSTRSRTATSATSAERM